MTARTYSEVLGILNMLGEEYINNLPDSLFEFIKSEKDDDYNPIYFIDKSLEEQNICDDALSFITFLNLKYWCDEDEKKVIIKTLKKNDKKFYRINEVNDMFNKFEIESSNFDSEFSKNNLEENDNKLILHKDIHGGINNIFISMKKLLKKFLRR